MILIMNNRTNVAKKMSVRYIKLYHDEEKLRTVVMPTGLFY